MKRPQPWKNLSGIILIVLKDINSRIHPVTDDYRAALHKLNEALLGLFITCVGAAEDGLHLTLQYASLCQMRVQDTLGISTIQCADAIVTVM